MYGLRSRGSDPARDSPDPTPWSRKPPGGLPLGINIETEPQCWLDLQARNGVARVAIRGELDIATTPSLVDRVVHLERTDVVAIVLDLREVTFLDGSAVHAFLTAREHARQNGHRFFLVGVNRTAQRIFELSDTQYPLG